MQEMKIKLFTALGKTKLELEVNEFLASGVEILDIKYSIAYDCDDYNYKYSAMVIYKWSKKTVDK